MQFHVFYEPVELRQNKTSGTLEPVEPLEPVANVRLDQWLDVACLFKTRSEAQKACKLGKIVINGSAAKPHRDVKIGDELEISRPMGRKQLVTVLGLAETHV